MPEMTVACYGGWRLRDYPEHEFEWRGPAMARCRRRRDPSRPRDLAAYIRRPFPGPHPRQRVGTGVARSGAKSTAAVAEAIFPTIAEMFTWNALRG